ncbi:hypothetical protein [Mucilaginibacter sp.]|jgi:gas vesicle protein|uniref:hypothetical protein n=1 Tax=Mucilaginibacter sp. TaxID=1882438 RepID=UPI00261D297D|nr:hypothetical protein [Mucilaginibacter sp.]MDB4926617.1 hypothetical protein [Mucilaginibacter sp.]
MKNPFEKESYKGLIAGIAIGGVVAAGLAYLFFTEDGEELLAGFKHKLKDMAKDIGAGIVSDKTGVSKPTVKQAADIVVG